MQVMNEFNPGCKLRDLLHQPYPYESPLKADPDENYFVARIDQALIAEIKFERLIYESSINYMLRRLITTTEYLKRRYNSNDYPPEKFILELRYFIKEYTKIPESESEKVLALLQLCVEARNRRLKTPRRKRVRKNAEEKGEFRCYICGRSLTQSEAGKDDQVSKVTIDHFWPQAMRGSTEDFNLRVSCSYCNEEKQDYIDASDFHYEEICLVSDQEQDDSSFDVEFQKQYKIALWAKTNYTCSLCGKPASEVGKLTLCRIDPNDSWHFLNVEAYCNEHTPK